MIKANSEYGLEGAFKADFYDANGNFINSTDYFSNFITYSGLLYPLTYHFPECFKFLSLGNSSSANSITTTGLLGSPIALTSKDAFDNINYATQTLSYLGPVYYSKENCGVSIGKDGPAYFRAWRIPSGDTAVAADNITIKEFMVSPSSGTDTTGNVAFSRVVREVTLKSGNSAILTYRLKLKILSTGTNYLTGFDISNADLEDGALVSDWATATGVYRQVYHGLAAIDINGNSFIPKYGDIMEPASRNQKNFIAYFSPDYAQFATNTITGKQLSFANSYKADGLLNVAYNHDYSNVVVSEAPEEYVFKKTTISSYPENDKNYASNIRYDSNFPNYNDFTGDLESASFKNANFDYSKISLATPGITGFDSDSLDVRNKASVSAGVFTESFNATGALQQNRKKTLSRKIIFTPNKSYGTNTRYGSFVYGYKNGSDIWPAIDCIFYNKSGQLLMAHYRDFTGFHNFEIGSGVGTGKAVLSPEINNYFNYDLLVDSNGSVTGFVKTENYKSGIFDRYLQRHSLVYNTEPEFTGAAFHPSGYPHFDNTDQIKLVYKDLQFFAKGFGYIPTGYYEFSPSKQVLHEVTFSGNSYTNLLKDPIKLSESRITGEDSAVSGGFFLSRIQFTNSGEENDANKASLIGGLDGVLSEQYLTGYLYSGDTLIKSFNVFADEETLSIDANTNIEALRLNRLVNELDSTGSALASLAQRGSGLLNIPNAAYILKFSGQAPSTSTGLAFSGWSAIACTDNGKTVVVAANNNDSYVYYNLSGGESNSWLPLTGSSGNWVALTKSNNDGLFHGITDKNYFRLPVDEEKFPIACNDYEVAYSKTGYILSGSINGSTREFTVSNYGVIDNSLFIKTGDSLVFNEPAIEDYSVNGITITDSGLGYSTGQVLYAIGGKNPDGTEYTAIDAYALSLIINSTGLNGEVGTYTVNHSGSYLSGDYFDEAAPFTWEVSNGTGQGFAANPNSFVLNQIRGSLSVKSINTSNKTFTFTKPAYAKYKSLAQDSKLTFSLTGNSGSFIDIDADNKIYVIARAGNSSATKRNFIFNSSSSGENWELSYFDNESDKFKKIACSEDGEIACATRSFDNLLISKNGGLSWEDSSCPFNWTSIDMSNNAEIIVALAKTDYINAGDHIYISYDTGSSWYFKKDAGIRDWKEVAVSSNGRRIIASPENGFIYKSFNSGQNWSASEFETGWAGLAASSDGKINFGIVNSGYVYAPLTNYEKLYITYVNNTGNYTWQASSNLTGIPVYTQFKEPSGVPIHREAGKVRPNNYFLGNTGEVLSITGGGAYPGLSDKNNLEIQINMSWSSACAGVAGCTEPS